MELDNYSKRELDMKFDYLANKIDENHDETMDRIELLSRTNNDKHLENSDKLENIEQKVTLTNGKVRKLEKWQAALIMSGSVAIFMGCALVGLVVYIYQYQLNQQAVRVTNLKTQVQVLQNK